MSDVFQGAELEGFADGTMEPEFVERVRRMERCLERMTDPTRSIVKQCYYDGKKYREVAEERGITPDGVKKHIVKALRMLREELGCGEKRRGKVPGKTDET